MSAALQSHVRVVSKLTSTKDLFLITFSRLNHQYFDVGILGQLKHQRMQLYQWFVRMGDCERRSCEEEEGGERVHTLEARTHPAVPPSDNDRVVLAFHARPSLILVPFPSLQFLAHVGISPFIWPSLTTLLERDRSGKRQRDVPPAIM